MPRDAAGLDGGIVAAMPIYLVRWPRLQASVVFAEDEEHLAAMLDEVADPGGTSWTEYLGSLWIDFELRIEVGDKTNGHA